MILERQRWGKGGYSNGFFQTWVPTPVKDSSDVFLNIEFQMKIQS